MKTDRLLTRYQNAVVPKIVHLFSPVKILISGSRVKGTATKDSDIDVIVVADAFLGSPLYGAWHLPYHLHTRRDTHSWCRIHEGY